MKRDKVILVNPGIHFQKPIDYGMYPNTAIMVLATILRTAGFRVTVIDGRYKTVDGVVERVVAEASEGTSFIGFSVMTIQLPWAYRVSQAIKARLPGVPIVWGGVHTTLFPEQTVEDPAIDAIVVGDAARTVVDLARAFGEGSDLGSVPGICYKDRGKVSRTPDNALKDDFGCIPFIDFDLIDHRRAATKNVVATEPFYGGAYADRKTYPIITGLGCTYQCTFCINVILGKRYHFREAGEIVERIKELKAKYGADFIQPLDENFFISRRRTNEFLDLLEREDLGIKWRPQLRADYFGDSYLNLEMVRRLERSGMVVAAIGVESASQKTLDRIKKQITVEQVIKATEILSKTKIVPKLSFMVGLPGETMDEMRQTYQLAMRLRRMARQSCVVISPFRPYPGSPLFDQVVKEYGYRTPSSLGEWANVSEREFLEGDGYESFEEYRWIARPKWLRAMQTTYGELASDRSREAHPFVSRCFRVVANVALKLRCPYLFYFFKEGIRSILKVVTR